MEIDILDDLPIRMQRMVDRPVLDPEHRIADVRFALREAMLEVAIHHLADDAILLDGAGLAIQRIDGATVAQHGDAVGNTRHLIELVRDQDRRHALGAELKQRSSSAALSLSLRLAVGSSRIKRRTSLDSALAISTSCCLPIPILVTSVSGASSSPTFASSCCERL